MPSCASAPAPRPSPVCTAIDDVGQTGMSAPCRPRAQIHQRAAHRQRGETDQNISPPIQTRHGAATLASIHAWTRLLLPRAGPTVRPWRRFRPAKCRGGIPRPPVATSRRRFSVRGMAGRGMEAAGDDRGAKGRGNVVAAGATDPTPCDACRSQPLGITDWKTGCGSSAGPVGEGGGVFHPSADPHRCAGTRAQDSGFSRGGDARFTWPPVIPLSRAARAE
jgi:hypothetical protein